MLLECRVITLNQVQVTSAAFPRCSLRKIFQISCGVLEEYPQQSVISVKLHQQRYCNHSLLWIISERFCKSLRKIQEATLNNYFSSFTNHADTSVLGCDFLIFFIITIPTSQEFIWIKCLLPGKLGVNEGVGCQNLIPRFFHLPSVLHDFVIIFPLCNKSYPTFK